MKYDKNTDEEKLSLLASVANLYYNSDLTQNEIAERFFTSRSKISRMIKEARELGVVQITIREPFERNIQLENFFREKFHLTDVRIMVDKENDKTLRVQKLGEVAAYYIDNIIGNDTVLGMSWGNTVYHTVQAVKSNKNIPLTVVPIMGGAETKRPEKGSLDLTKKFADAYGGTYHYIYAPLFVKSKELRHTLMEEPSNYEAIKLARHADLILTSVGSVINKSWRNYLTDKSLEILEARGAIGHIGGHFYDILGREIVTNMTNKMVGIDLADFKKVNNVICVAGTVEKAECILGAIRGGYINTLITDDKAASKVLEISIAN